MSQWLHSSKRAIAWLVCTMLVLATAASAAWGQSVAFTLQNAQSVGNGTAMPVSGLSVVGVTIIGTAGADETVTFQVAGVGTSFNSVTCRNVNGNATATTQVVSGTTIYNYQCPVGGFILFRTVISGGVPTGTLTITAVGLSQVSWMPPATAGGGPAASSTSTYLLQTADAAEPNAQAMGALGSGLVFNTTGTGVQSIYTTSGTGTVVCLTAACALTGVTGLGIRDTTAAFDVTLTATSTSATLTAGRALTLDMGNVAHILTLGTTASTGSGIIFPNTATDTIAMLGIANQFAPVITANNFAMLLAGSVDRSGSTTAQAVSALKMTTALTAEQNGSAPGRSVYGHYLNFGTMTAISGAANNVFADLAISPAVLSKPGGATIATRAALYIDAAPSGGITNYAIYASGTVAVVGTLTATAIASNAAAQTGYLCYNSAAPGTITYDGGATCLVSLEEFKDRVGPITGALALVDQLQPFWGSYKHGTPMSDHHIQPFLGAHQVESVDPRLVTYTDSGELHGVRYQNLSAVLVASIQEEHHLTTDLMRDLQALKARVRHLER